METDRETTVKCLGSASSGETFAITQLSASTASKLYSGKSLKSKLSREIQNRYISHHRKIIERIQTKYIYENAIQVVLQTVYQIAPTIAYAQRAYT